MTSKPIRAIVVGGTGYTGAELVRLALGHPSLELVSIVGNTTAGQAACCRSWTDISDHAGTEGRRGNGLASA